ncbi:MAG: phasin family protein [Alphaproteobacteria bacterium]
MAEPKNPFLDFDVAKLMADMKMPGIDTSALLAAQQRNVEAIAKANQLAAEGMQAVAKRQAEMLRTSMEEASRTMTAMMANTSPEERVAKQAELTKAAFEKAIANMREISELLARANKDTLDVINRRVSEGLDEVRELMATAAEKGAPKPKR